MVGCYSQRAPEEVAKIEGVSAVIGTADKMKCVEIAKKLLNSKFEIRNSKLIGVTTLESAEFEPMCVKSAPRTRAIPPTERAGTNISVISAPP